MSHICAVDKNLGVLLKSCMRSMSFANLKNTPIHCIFNGGHKKNLFDICLHFCLHAANLQIILTLVCPCLLGPCVFPRITGQAARLHGFWAELQWSTERTKCLNAVSNPRYRTSHIRVNWDKLVSGCAFVCVGVGACVCVYKAKTFHAYKLL